MRRLLAASVVASVAVLWGGGMPPAAQEAPPTVMVVDFAVGVGWASAAELVTDRLVARLRQEGAVRVLSRAQTRAALEAAQLDTRGLLDVRDVSRAASRAGADYVLMGEVDQFDQTYSGGCLPIVGCVYTVTATVRMRGVVVDAETAMILARPEAQARGQQGAASVWVGPWWTHVSVETFDSQLIGRVTLEAVGQFVTRARPALRPKPSRGQGAQPAPTPAAGGLERPQVAFQRGSRVLLNEDFSTCSVRPAGWRVMAGTVECVRSGGKTWLAGVRGEVWVEREIPGFDPSRDFALEVTFLVQRRGGGEPDPWLYVAAGRRDSPVRFELKWQNNYRGHWADKPLPDVAGELVQTPRRLGVVRQGELVHVFIEGQRALSDSVDGVSLGRQPRQVTVGFGEVDIERQRYVLVSDIVVSHPQ